MNSLTSTLHWTGVYLNDLHGWNPVTLTWKEMSQANTIPKRILAGASSASGKFYIFGGASDAESRLNDLQVWDPLTSTWAALSSDSSPSARVGHGLAAIESLKKLYLFGGVINSTGTDSLSSEFYEFDLITSTWRNLSALSSAIAPRSFFGFATAADKIFMSGGLLNRDDGGSCGMYQYDTSASSWSCVSVLGIDPNRMFVLPAMVSHGKKMFVYGGFASEGAANDSYF
jgi:N-acetylneuraminic acid mutarotase